MLLYELSKRKDEFPVLECIDGFDWDSPAPKVKGWEDVVNAITVGSICSSRVGGSRAFLCADRMRSKNFLFFDYPELTEEIFNIALTIKDFFERPKIKV